LLLLPFVASLVVSLAQHQGLHKSDNP
jgi:hypothetical protein